MHRSRNMWMPFLYDGINYLMNVDEDGAKVSLTDLKSLWHDKIQRDNLVERFKDLNPLFNGNEEDTFAQAVRTMRDVNSICLVNVNGSECDVHVKSRLVDLPIRMECRLVKAEPQCFYEEVTVPLLKTVQFLELKKNKLAELLIKKDKEIMEYNMEFGEISRKTIITEKYEKENEDTVNDLLLNLFTKSDDFYNNLVQQHGDLLEQFPELQEIKPEKRKLTLPKHKRSKKKRA